ncbi:MAG: GNAT family N-acetyltransferase [Sphaerochaeta sp.]
MTHYFTNSLTKQQKAAVRNLQKICFAFEQLENGPLLSNFLNIDKTLPCFFLAYEGEDLVGFLEAFFPTTEEIEINAFVHPDHRRKGIFSALVSEARKVYAPHPFLQMLFQVETSSESGKTYMENRFPHIDRSEYRLKLSKTRWQEKKKPAPKTGTLVEATGEYLQLFIRTATSLLREDAAFIERMMNSPKRKGYLYIYNDKPIGVMQKCEEEESLGMLYGVAIDEAYRGQGHGKAMLQLALDTLFDSCDFLALEVDSQNPRAFGLYRDLGFEIEFQVNYHRLILLSN